jgi:hypothetical protein
MASNKIRMHTVLAQDHRCRHGNREDRRLSVGGKLKRFRWALEADLRNSETQRRVRVCEYLPSDFEILRQLSAHAGVLRALTGK